MTCQDCHSPDCKVAEARRKELAELEGDGNPIAWLKAEQDLHDALSECAAGPPTKWQAKLAALEARLTALETKT